MQLYKCFSFAACAVGLVGLAASARADISGSAWLVPDGGDGSGHVTLCADNAVILCVPTSAANATFTLTNAGLTAGFNPTDSSAISTLGAFIGTNPDVVGSVTYNIATSATLLDIPDVSTAGTSFGACNTGTAGGGHVSGQVQCATIFEFTGSANFSTGEVFSVNSDDGVTLYVGCTASTCTSANAVLNDPGPQSLNTTSAVYNGSDGVGLQNFVFVYAECCDLPATFTTNFVQGGNVPEPTSVILLGTVVFGLASLIRRKYYA